MVISPKWRFLLSTDPPVDRRDDGRLEWTRVRSRRSPLPATPRSRV